MRNKKLAWNTISGLVMQATTVLCGFILPRAILNRFGSDVNGLINSIAQFLQMIAFLELGVGAVIQSALYKPLADGDPVKISEVLVSGSRFFRKLGGILVVYVAALVVVFPVLVDKAMRDLKKRNAVSILGFPVRLQVAAVKHLPSVW